MQPESHRPDREMRCGQPRAEKGGLFPAEGWLTAASRQAPPACLHAVPSPSTGAGRPAAPVSLAALTGVPAAGLALAPRLSPPHDDSTPLARGLARTSCSARKTPPHYVLLLWKMHVGGTGEPAMNAEPCGPCRPAGWLVPVSCPAARGSREGLGGQAGAGRHPPLSGHSVRHAGVLSGQARSPGCQEPCVAPATCRRVPHTPEASHSSWGARRPKSRKTYQEGGSPLPP